MDWHLKASRVAEVASQHVAEPGEIARRQWRVVTVLGEPELALFGRGVGAEDFCRDAAWRDFQHHEDQYGHGEHGQQHGHETLSEEEQHSRAPHPNHWPPAYWAPISGTYGRRSPA